MSQKAFTIPGPVGINTDTPSTVFEVVADSTSPDAIIRIRETQSFPTFDGSGSGLELIVGEANKTNKFTPAIKFGSDDSAFTTTTPKFGAAITASAAQAYGLDTHGGMDLGIWTAPINPGTGSGLVERINVKYNGQVSIGGITNFGGTLEVFSTGSGTPNSWISMTRGSNDASGPYLALVKSRSTDPLLRTEVLLNDELGSIVFQGTNGTTNLVGAAIKSITAAAPTSTNIQANLIFSTTNSTNILPSERMRITSVGDVGIGTGSPSAKVEITNSTAGYGSLQLKLSNVGGESGDDSRITLNNGTIASALVLRSNTHATEPNAVVLSASGANSLLFYTNGSERVRITSTGAIALSGATNTGTTGQALLSNGSNAAAWGNVSATSLSGQVPAANGGTGLNITGSGVVVYSSGVGALTSTTGTGSVVLSASPALTGAVTITAPAGIGTVLNASSTASDSTITGIQGNSTLSTTALTASRSISGSTSLATSSLINTTAFTPLLRASRNSATWSGGSSTNIGNIYGSENTVLVDTTEGTNNKVNSVFSVIGTATSSNLPTVNSIGGAKYNTYVGATNTTLYAYGTISTVQTNAGSSVTNAYGTHSSIIGLASSSITNSYIFYGQSTYSGTATNRYGLYLESNVGNSYIGGGLSVGGTAPTGTGVQGVGIGVSPPGTDGALSVKESISTTTTGAVGTTRLSVNSPSGQTADIVQILKNSSALVRVDSTGKILANLASATGDAVLQVSNGIYFGTPVSSDSNTLDYYQEGTWTPTVVGTTTAGTGTYLTQYGTYTRIGNRVQFSAIIQMTAHTGTGNIRISGLPFTSTSYVQVVNILSQNLTFTGQLSAYVVSSTSNIELVALVSNATWNPVLMDTVFNIWINGIYQVA